MRPIVRIRGLSAKERDMAQKIRTNYMKETKWGEPYHYPTITEPEEAALRNYVEPEPAHWWDFYVLFWPFAKAWYSAPGPLGPLMPLVGMMISIIAWTIVYALVIGFLWALDSVI